MSRSVPVLPSAGDPAWRHAPARLDQRQMRWLPFKPPYVPDLDDTLRALRSSAGLVLLEDGFPGRLRGGEIVVHPMDGRYLLDALLKEAQARPGRHLRGFVERTAEAIIGRAEVSGQGLLMRYRDTASTMVDGAPHLSALPQAYYAAGLARAARLLDRSDLATQADRFFLPLTVSTSRPDGLLYRTAHGPVPAIVPTTPRDYVLNGWLSVLVALDAYAGLRDSAVAHRFVRASAAALTRLLPLYDVPALRLSRYGLTGPVGFDITVEPLPSSVSFSRLQLTIPGEGKVPIAVARGGRWVPRVEAADVLELHADGAIVPQGARTRLSCILSRAPHPRPNRLAFTVRTSAPITVRTAAHMGRYDPLTSATLDRQRIILDERAIAPGRRRIEVDLPYDRLDLFAYPTNFTRGLPGERVNVYHGTHIVRLRQLAERLSMPALADWADRWASYAEDWPSDPLLAGGICRTPEGEWRRTE